MFVTSVCSSRECTQSTVLYGSTTAVATCGQHHKPKNGFVVGCTKCLGIAS